MRSNSSCRRARVVNPQYPATVNHYFPTSHVVYTCVLAALGKLNPARAVAPSGFGNGAIAIGYAQGPRRQADGAVRADGDLARRHQPRRRRRRSCCRMNHFTPGTPVEIVETEYPVMVERYDIWRDSRGAGRQRGGIGHVREYQRAGRLHPHRAHLEPPPGRIGPQRRQGAAALAHPDQSRHAARGGDGLHGDARRYLPARCIRLEQTGGAGYGEPARARARAGASGCGERLRVGGGGEGGVWVAVHRHPEALDALFARRASKGGPIIVRGSARAVWRRRCAVKCAEHLTMTGGS